MFSIRRSIRFSWPILSWHREHQFYIFFQGNSEKYFNFSIFYEMPSKQNEIKLFHLKRHKFVNSWYSLPCIPGRPMKEWSSVCLSNSSRSPEICPPSSNFSWCTKRDCIIFSIIYQVDLEWKEIYSDFFLGNILNHVLFNSAS